jgi:putative aldouronate transport system permease protein
MWHKKTTPKIRIKNVKSDISLTLFALPTMVYIFIFSYIPLVGLIIAFKDYNAIQGIFGSPWTSKFGFNHFFNFITLPNFKMILKILLLPLALILFISLFPFTIPFTIYWTYRNMIQK